MCFEKAGIPVKTQVSGLSVAIACGIGSVAGIESFLLVAEIVRFRTKTKGMRRIKGLRSLTTPARECSNQRI